MRNVLLLLTTLFFSLNGTHADEWTWLSPRPQGNTIECCFFLDSLNGWAAGENGVIINSTDAGESWQVIYTELKKGIDRIKFMDKNHGWCISDYRLYETSDGGHSWFDIAFIDSNDNLYDIEIPEWNQVYVSGRYGRWPNLVLYKSVNGGANWIRYKFDTLECGSHLSFVNGSLGFAAHSSGIIMKTTNGGKNWIELDFNLNVRIHDLIFADESHGWAAGYNSNKKVLIATRDGGNSWFVQYESQGWGFDGVYFIDRNQGWILDSPGAIYRTENGGDDWLRAFSTGCGYMNCIEFTDVKNGWAFGAFGNLARSRDGGQTWDCNNNMNNVDFSSICFVDSETGWLGGPEDEIFRSDDGGESWKPYDIPFFGINDMSFPNEDAGWIAGNNGEIARSLRGGPWESVEIWTSEDLKGIHFLNESTGWIVGSGTPILHTSDGGKNWSAQADGRLWWLYDIDFYDDFGVAVGGFSEKRQLLVTTDGGKNWKEYKTDNENALYSVDVINENIAWAGGKYGHAVFTTNSGDSWIDYRIGYGDISDIRFTGESEGWIVNAKGRIYHTSNAGINWMACIPEAGSPINSICFIEDGTGWLCGENGIIMKYADTSSTSASRHHVSNEYELKIAPNPAADFLEISWQSKKAAQTEIIIYSVFGLPEKKAFSGIAATGENNMIINITNLPAGVYFISLRDGSDTYFAKFIKIE